MKHEVLVKRISKVEPHPNADRLDIVGIDAYQCVCQKGLHTEGDLVIYIPENSVIPERILKRMGFWKDDRGTLGGPNGDVVRPIKLRGILSQGVVMPMSDFLHGQSYADLPSEGLDLAIALNITKYEPPIPPELEGQVYACGYTFKFDVEDIKKYPHVLEEGEEVFLTEKLHGVLCCVVLPAGSSSLIVSSKGLIHKGLAFTQVEEGERPNLYQSVAVDYERQLRWIGGYYNYEGSKDVYILGEIYGKGVQDLHYYTDGPRFRVFDVYVGTPGMGNYIDRALLYRELEGMGSWGLRHVPVLDVIPFSREAISTYVDGAMTSVGDYIPGTGNCIREGIVITPMVEREDPSIGRVILKSINPDYLVRKGGTEYS